MRMQEKTPETILFARDTDGAYPVHVLKGDRYKVITPDGPKVYHSKRQLLIALTGHPKARNWTFDRYFKLNDPEPESLLGWFTTPKVKLGIDLVERGHEVAKLLFAGFGSWIRTAGYDPQEVLQEVYVGILVRNQGKCPWDARKSSFGHYVHMVCNGVLSNYHRKKKRVRSNEQTGVRAYDAQGDYREQDVAATNIPAPMDASVERFEVLEATDDLLEFIPHDPTTHLVRQIIPYLRDGYTRTDIARELGVTRTRVSQAQRDLQEWATRWHQGAG